MGDFIGQASLLKKIDERKGISYFRFETGKNKIQHHFGTTGHRNTGSGQLVPIEINKKNHICDSHIVLYIYFSLYGNLSLLKDSY